jgi:hypothetical protein
MTTKEGVYFVADRVELFGDVPEFSVINELQKATPKKDRQAHQKNHVHF